MWTESSWAFPKSYTADDIWIVRSSDGGQQKKQKRLYLHHQDDFQLNYYTFVSLHDSDHEGVVRIFVALSCEL